MSPVEQLHKHFERQKDWFLENFFTFLRFESVSSEKSHKTQTLACAEWLRANLERIGMDVSVWKTSGYPVLFATHMKAGKDKPTILLYGHYDVQPTDPEGLWQSPPFEPTVRDNTVYARGAVDDKGQIFYTICALEHLLTTHGELPVNVKLLIEGEEEIGSEGLSEVLEKKSEELQADHLLLIDGGFPRADMPAISLGVRGIATMTVTVQGATTDLHSGTHGGIVLNPNQALVQILAKLHDSNGRVAVPGFYENVLELTPLERNNLTFNFDEADYEKTFGAKPVGAESGYSPIESAWLRPTLEINGISGGYAGEGFKTVIPAQAIAKISCRLVPEQNPERIAKLVAKFIKDLSPEGVRTQVQIHPGMGKAARTSPESKVAKVAACAYEEVFSKPCAKIFEGGSIPIASELARVSGADMLLMGYGLPTDGLHAPNEHFGLERFEKGFVTVIRILELFSEE